MSEKTFEEYLLMSLAKSPVEIVNDKNIEHNFESGMHGILDAFDCYEGSPLVVFDARGYREYNNMVTDSRYYDDISSLQIDSQSSDIFKSLDPDVNAFLELWRSESRDGNGSIISMLLGNPESQAEILLDSGDKYILLKSIATSSGYISAGNIVSLHSSEECVKIKIEKAYTESSPKVIKPENLYINESELDASFFVEMTPDIEKKLSKGYGTIIKEYVENNVKKKNSISLSI